MHRGFLGAGFAIGIYCCPFGVFLEGGIVVYAGIVYVQGHAMLLGDFAEQGEWILRKTFDLGTGCYFGWVARHPRVAFGVNLDKIGFNRGQQAVNHPFAEGFAHQ